MSDQINAYLNSDYEAGFITDVEAETLPPGLNEDVIRFISAKKSEPQWLLEWRLKAYQDWLKMSEPQWAHVNHPPIDFNSVSYFSAPKSLEDRPQSLDEVDPELLRTYEKLGIPLHEQATLAGVPVDVVFDSVHSVSTGWTVFTQCRNGWTRCLRYTVYCVRVGPSSTVAMTEICCSTLFFAGI